MWILKDQIIVNMDNVVSVLKNSNGNLEFHTSGDYCVTMKDVPEDIIHKIWMANKRKEEIFVIN